jgi:hypothetical protein
MDKKNIFVTVVLAVLVSFGVSYLSPSEVVKTIVEKQVGAVSSPVLNSSYFSFGGVMNHQYRTPMAVATTTLCVFKSPAATSTLDFVGWQIYTGTSTAANIDIAKATTQWATTTLLVTGTSVASGAQGVASWTSAGATAADDLIAPSTYVLVKTATPGLGGYTYGGVCTARFQEF